MPQVIQRPFGRASKFCLFGIMAAMFLSAPVNLAAQGQTSAQTTGAGTYVCTPAGFGRKSTCYRR